MIQVHIEQIFILFIILSVIEVILSNFRLVYCSQIFSCEQFIGLETSNLSAMDVTLKSWPQGNMVVDYQ